MSTSNTQSRPQAFPETRRTWMGRVLDEGDVASARRHVMEVYAEPLRIYCAGCSLRWVGEPADLVAGFFASRLSRPAFLDRWRESRRPLRFWLIVGFKHFLLEEARRRRRHARERSDPGLEPAGAEPDDAFDRACALEIVRRALRDAEHDCRAAGLAGHWEAFTRFHLRDEPLERIGASLGVDASRAAVMKRTAAARFRSSVRELVSWDDASDAEIDAEVRSLMEVLR